MTDATACTTRSDGRVGARPGCCRRLDCWRKKRPRLCRPPPAPPRGPHSVAPPPAPTPPPAAAGAQRRETRVWGWGSQQYAPSPAFASPVPPLTMMPNKAFRSGIHALQRLTLLLAGQHGMEMRVDGLPLHEALRGPDEVLEFGLRQKQRESPRGQGRGRAAAAGSRWACVADNNVAAGGQPQTRHQRYPASGTNAVSVTCTSKPTLWQQPPNCGNRPFVVPAAHLVLCDEVVQRYDHGDHVWYSVCSCTVGSQATDGCDEEHSEELQPTGHHWQAQSSTVAAKRAWWRGRPRQTRRG